MKNLYAIAIIFSTIFGLSATTRIERIEDPRLAGKTAYQLKEMVIDAVTHPYTGDMLLLSRDIANGTENYFEAFKKAQLDRIREYFDDFLADSPLHGGSCTTNGSKSAITKITKPNSRKVIAFMTSLRSSIEGADFTFADAFALNPNLVMPANIANVRQLGKLHKELKTVLKTRVAAVINEICAGAGPIFNVNATTDNANSPVTDLAGTPITRPNDKNKATLIARLNLIIDSAD